MAPFAVALLGASSTRASSDSTARAMPLVLRLSDVSGYSIERTGPDPTCSAPVFIDEVRRDVLRLLRRSWQAGCNLMLERMWTAPGMPTGPFTLQSVAEIMTGPTAAAALLHRPRAFASSLVPIPISSWKPPARTIALGDEALLLRSGRVPYSDERHGAAVVWRSGSVVALVYATGCAQRACEQAALRLAAVQQARIDAPTPVSPTDFDDSQVGLADPRLDVPVWWAGRDFEGPGLRKVRLLSSASAAPAFRRDGDRVTLTYGLNETWPAFQITLAHPSALERPAARRDLRSVTRDRCVRSERFTAPAGTATLYWRRRHCRTDLILDPPMAFLRRPDVLIVVGCSDCFSVQQGYRPLRRYGSLAAVRTIVRSLRLRETPAP